MYCEWAAKVIAFDPKEMEQMDHRYFLNTHFILGTNVRQFWTEHSKSPSLSPIAGFLDAFEGLTLPIRHFLIRPVRQNLVWLIESSASKFNKNANAPDTALTDYGIFIGTEFGNYAKAQSTGYQESRHSGSCGERNSPANERSCVAENSSCGLRCLIPNLRLGIRRSSMTRVS